MKYGPVDVLAVAIGEPKFDGRVIAELASLADKGVVRVLDAMVLVMNEDGEVSGIDIEDLPEEYSGALGYSDEGHVSLFSSEDADKFREGMVPGSAIVALAVENSWAVPLINSILDAGAEVAVHTRIPATLVDDALTALEAE